MSDSNIEVPPGDTIIADLQAQMAADRKLLAQAQMTNRLYKELVDALEGAWKWASGADDLKASTREAYSIEIALAKSRLEHSPDHKHSYKAICTQCGQDYRASLAELLIRDRTDRDVGNPAMYVPKMLNLFKEQHPWT